MTNQQVFEAFAKGHSADAGSTHSEGVREGAVLYSYATPVAYPYLNDGHNVAIFTDRRYSVTTTKQVSQAKSVCEHRGLRVEVVNHQEFVEKAKLMGASFVGAR